MKGITVKQLREALSQLDSVGTLFVFKESDEDTTFVKIHPDESTSFPVCVSLVVKDNERLIYFAYKSSDDPKKYDKVLAFNYKNYGGAMRTYVDTDGDICMKQVYELGQEYSLDHLKYDLLEGNFKTTRNLMRVLLEG